MRMQAVHLLDQRMEKATGHAPNVPHQGTQVPKNEVRIRKHRKMPSLKDPELTNGLSREFPSKDKMDPWENTTSDKNKCKC